MKAKLIIAITVIVVLIGFCVFDEIYVANTFRDFTEMLKIEEQKQSFDIEEIEAINRWWKETHQKLEVIVPHTQLNEITYAFGEFLGTIKANDLKSAEGQLHRLIETSEAMQAMYSFRLGNLF